MFKCQTPHVIIVDAASNYTNSNRFKQNDLIELTSKITINCLTSLANQKQWSIHQLDQLTGNFLEEVFIANNPTITYACLVLQPKTLSYGLYKIIFTVTMENVSYTSFAETFIQIIPSGLVLSSLKSSQPMYGGTIEITRGQNQKIEFDPFIFTYDIDNVGVISSLTFKYACQIIDSNVPQGYPQIPGTNQLLYLDDVTNNSSISYLEKCFDSKSKIFFKRQKKIECVLSVFEDRFRFSVYGDGCARDAKILFIYLLLIYFIFKFQDDYSFEFSNNILKLNGGTLKYVPNRKYEIYVSTLYMNREYSQKIQITIEVPPIIPIASLE